MGGRLEWLHLQPRTTGLPLVFPWVLVIVLAGALVSLLDVIVDVHPVSLLWVCELPKLLPQVLHLAQRLCSHPDVGRQPVSSL